MLYFSCVAAFVRVKGEIVRILVTGGAGFIGSHVADRYIELGHEVAVLDDFSHGRAENVNPRARVYRKSILDDDLAAVLQDFRPEAVSHHAAQVNVRKSVDDPGFDAQVNVLGSLRVYQAAVACACRKVIYASSGGACYGPPARLPAAEATPIRPVCPYGVSKHVAEKYLELYGDLYGLRYTVLRYANVYGPRQDPHGEAGVVAIFSRKMLDRQEAFINGDGLQTRDYVFVGDIIRANLAALKLEGYHTINIGTGTETDVLTIFDTLNRLTGANQPRRHRPAPGGEQRRSSIDPSLAADLLSWKPQVDLEDGLCRTVDYFRISKR